ncbi:tumor necrosis factor receptor superfamily member 1A [Spea bombifrons]|uniref:tumor necrosis factor receptor superfamily member 1A n=1 Tax=Spea bombifrons TaxID=233779 RepID=UPI00234AAA9E|nr:tumor necrosis factor receptor superfamily member 1A [Spea bombifrons]
MRRLLLVVLLSGPFFSSCLNLSIPLQAALLVRGEPVGFGRAKRAVEGEDTEPPCPGDEYRHPDLGHCCKKCLSGFRRITHCPEQGIITKCAPCPNGQFIDLPNYSRGCLMCTQCIPSLGQIILSNCTRERDTVCGCPPGQFKIIVGSSFRCENCSQCGNGDVLIPCKESNDTVCTCHHDYFLDHSKRTCEKCGLCKSEECRKRCPPVERIKSPEPVSEDTVWKYVVPPVGLLVIIVFAVACYIYKRRSPPKDVSGNMWKNAYDQLFACFKLILALVHPLESLKETLYPTFVDISMSAMGEDCLSSTAQEAKLICQTTTPEDPTAFAGTLIHTRQIMGIDVANNCQALPLPDITTEPRAQQFQKPEDLYTLIDIIPVSRWREFVRRLGLSDNDIEKSEEENRRFREAQYDMLITWRNRAGPSGATKDEVSRVLKDMELGGCLERFLECQ